MWSNKYDEDLHNNIFFKEMLRNHCDLVSKISQNNWVICVPKAGTLEAEQVTTDLIRDHILIPNTSSAEQPYYTLSEKPVTIKNRQVIDECPSTILFEETFYNQDLKYLVFCVERPLFVNQAGCETHELVTLETLHDCIDFLWAENLEHMAIKIQKLCDSFIEQNRGFQLENLQTQKELIGSLYSQCLQLVLKNRRLNSDCCDNLKLAVETYMQSCLGKILIKAINTVTCFRDANLNKIVCNFRTVKSKDIKSCDVLASAQWELNKINNYTTILDKVNCLKLTFNNLYKGNDCLTTDNVLHNFIFLIVKSNITTWISNLVYLTHFWFSCIEPSNDNNFLITTLEAALEFIKSEEFIKSASKEHIAQGAIFETIVQGNLTQLRTLLNHSKQNMPKLCHPLCDCDKCSLDSDHILSMTNEKGQNLLAFATIVGRADMVEFLLGMQIDSLRDHLGRLPLHHACLSGHQGILLILVNCKVEVNSKDFEGNTPLHLACQNGHDNCVKALFYTAKNMEVNAVNNSGETPLLIATKYNYVGIVKVLLENGALVTIGNKKKQVLFDLVQNYYTERLLRRYHEKVEPLPESDGCDHGLKPKGSQQKKIDLLLKAIENNDIPLTYFYLGFPNNPSSGNYDFQSKCHPLCNCEKCEQDDESPSVVLKEKLSVNTCNVDGFTPLHFAAKYGRTELFRHLLDSRALPNLKTYKTLQTPLHLACLYQQLSVVKELVKCGDCDIDALDYKGNTPLSYACLKGDTKIVDVLLGNGASSDKGFGTMDSR